MTHLKMILMMLKSIIHCLYINDKLDPYQLKDIIFLSPFYRPTTVTTG
jgi:hypothetical protein